MQVLAASANLQAPMFFAPDPGRVCDPGGVEKLRSTDSKS